MKVIAVMATCGRHYLCERSVGMFLDQTYPDKHLLIIQNSDVSQTLDKQYDNITLINKTGFSCVGDIYMYAREHIANDTDAFCVYDDDDIYQRDHIEQGVAGLKRGGLKAYKPEYSYFKHGNNKVTKIKNVLEPSWFVKYDVIKDQGFNLAHASSHLKWINWCLHNKQVFEDPKGPATFTYTWGNPERPTSKTTGLADKPESFSIHRERSQDHGDQIITPWTPEQLAPVYLAGKDLA